MNNNDYIRTDVFIDKYKKAFGEAELPITFWYSDEPASEVRKTRHCFIKDLKLARGGGMVSFDEQAISCRGGKTYTGFIPVASHIPDFVSRKERYKQTPEMVKGYIDEMDQEFAPGKYINFASISQIDSFSGKEGLVFFASPDMLSGLISWTFYDNSNADAVSVPFGSGCALVVTKVIMENRAGGHRTFLGLFDPSVRSSVEPNVLSLGIPMSRFRDMYDTFDYSCLGGTKTWMDICRRINGDE